MTNSNQENIYNVLREMSEKLGKIDGKLEGLTDVVDVRIQALERTDNRQWWIHATVVPFLAAAHALARKYGVTI